LPLLTPSDVGRLTGGQVTGDDSVLIDRIGSLERATPSTVSFLAQARYLGQMATTEAGCVLLAPRHLEAGRRLRSVVVCDDPYLAFARLTQWWAAQDRDPWTPGFHPTAVVDPSARVHPDAYIGPFVVVGACADIASGVVIDSHSVVQAHARVGTDSRVGPRVHIGRRCVIGARCIAHPGVVIGADGFGFAPDEGRWEKIAQLGAVQIGDDVEIGANTCIDRGALEDTTIGDGVKLDNLVQIGHNVRVGPHTAMAGCVGVAGSARIGAHCSLGGGAIILGHLELADHVQISAATVVTRSILQPGLYSGVFPFDDNAQWEKNAATLRQLHRLRERLRALENRFT
jgi:UDP-3-O-[3-hydroxymyristoyl] glucosamine N-acyltransferase